MVIGCDDPSEKASGRGPGTLRDEGVEVVVADGAEAATARLLIQPFRKHARTGRPLVTLKSALSLDGFTATEAGVSKWISGPASRALVHTWRADADAVAVGIGTALADDPLLTARDVEALQAAPARARRLRFGRQASARFEPGRLARRGARSTSFADTGADPERLVALHAAGADVIEVAGDRAARIGAALEELGRRGITSLLLEGGAELAGSFFDAGELDELRLFIAPVLLGRGRRCSRRGRAGRSPTPNGPWRLTGNAAETTSWCEPACANGEW